MSHRSRRRAPPASFPLVCIEATLRLRRNWRASDISPHGPAMTAGLAHARLPSWPVKLGESECAVRPRVQRQGQWPAAQRMQLATRENNLRLPGSGEREATGSRCRRLVGRLRPRLWTSWHGIARECLSIKFYVSQMWIGYTSYNSGSTPVAPTYSWEVCERRSGDHHESVGKAGVPRYSCH